MKTPTLLWLFCAGLLCGLLASAAPSRRTQKSRPVLGDEAAVITLLRDLSAAIQAKNADGVMQFYVHSNDLVVFDPGPKFDYKGWEAYYTEWKRFFADIQAMNYAQYLPEHIRISGTLGFVTGRWRMKFVSGAGEDVALEGRLTEVVEKAGGKWRILHEHTSLPISQADVTPERDPALNPGVQYFEAGVEGDGASGIQGVAEVSPIHGGPERVGEKNSRPLPDAVITVQREGGSLTLAQQRTAANGKFRIALKPGRYLVVGLPPKPGARLPRGSSQQVEVRAGKFTALIVGYDSGMR